MTHYSIIKIGRQERAGSNSPYKMLKIIQFNSALTENQSSDETFWVSNKLSDFGKLSECHNYFLTQYTPNEIVQALRNIVTRHDTVSVAQ